jgi:predicted ATPase/class 3 adenylate cyclase
MLELAGYSELAPIHHGQRSFVLRGRRSSDGLPIIVKTSAARYPTASDLGRLRHEFSLGRSTESGPAKAHVVRYLELAPAGASLALVVEDFGGRSLREQVGGGSVPIPTFVDIALSLSRCVNALHESRLLHLDLNPANILLNPQNRELRLCDLSAGANAVGAAGAPTFQGSPAYASPEQTQRTGRTVDDRSDLYSLGVTLFELLTGRLPFGGVDVLETFHRHLTVNPPSAQAFRADVPPTLARVLLKLLSKDPDDRYRSANGLVADLQRCRDEHRDFGAVSQFDLGRDDTSMQLYFPQRLHGREREVAELKAQFKRVQRGDVSFVLVSGEPGVGKSSLVEQMREQTRSQGGQYYAGKFEALRSNIPYAAFSGAFRAFLHRLLTRPTAELRRWRERLTEAVGPNGQLLIRLVPELERVIGPQPEPPVLDAEHSKARFRHLLLNLIDAMAAPDSPLVIFLDDLQWADQASLDLIEQMLSNSRFGYLMLVGAQRNAKIDASRPLSALLEKLAVLRPPTEIALFPLEAEDVQQIVAAALQTSVEQSLPLSRVVWRKTRGNPFFVSQFLRTLQSERLLWFDAPNRRFAWDLEACEEQVMTDNVIDLMVRRIERLDSSTKEILQHAACLGGEFSFEILANVCVSDLAEIERALAPALKTELVIRALLDDPSEHDGVSLGNLRFAHDQMQQAAYASIPEGDRAARHLAIGRALFTTWSPAQRHERAFQLLDHFSRGLALLSDDLERRSVAELCLWAGQRAKASNAYLAAAKHLSTGLGLLGDSGWREAYELTLSLHSEFAQCSYVAGDTLGMARSCAEIVGSAQTLLEKIPAYDLELLAHVTQNEMPRALTVAREVLAMLGVRLPARVSKLGVAITVLRMNLRLRKETEASLLARPVMKDKRILAAMQILAHAGAPAYLSSPLLFPLVMAQMLNLTLDYGVSEWSADAFVGWGAIQIAAFGSVERGNAVGSCAPRLVEQLGVPQHRGRIQTTYNLLIRHWLEPLQSTIEPLTEAVRVALEHGDLPYASVAGVTCVFYMLMAGRPLADVETNARALRKQLLPLGQERYSRDASRALQLVHCLQGKGPEPKRLRGEFFDDAEALRASIAVGDRAAIASLNYEKALLFYVYDDLPAALECCRTAARYIDSLVATVYAPALDFLSVLVRARLLVQGAATGKRSAELNLIRASLKRLTRWEKAAPANQSHRVALVRAELASLRGDRAEASEQYERAIALAERHGYVQEMAMSLECAGRFHARLGQARMASATLHAAREAWASWGAQGKADLLGAEFSSLLLPRQRATLSLPPSGGFAVPQAFELMDIGSVIKACQTIVSEIRLPRLVRRLLKLAMENTGAQRGFLFLNQDGQLRLSASADVDEGETPLKTEISRENIKTEPLLPHAIIDYVARLGQPLVEDNVSGGPLFADDPYVALEHPQSVLCVPLISQGALKGVLYLENNRMRGAFSADRVQVLSLLSALSAISLENARLYEDVEQAHALEVKLSRAQSRFVPAEFLRNLDRASIVDVELGDNIRKDMTVLFSDVRDFTRLVESMSPEQHIGFINRYLGYMEPAIVDAGGFVDSYLGDGIMALFEGDSDRALDAVIAMRRGLARFNQAHDEHHAEPVAMGVGVSSGPLTLGTIGGSNRLKCGVIGDPVNLASRLESLTKSFSCFALISEFTRNSLRNPLRFDLRMTDRVRVKGKLQPITLFEVLDAETEPVADAKRRTRQRFDEALMLYFAGKFADAGRLFAECRALCEHDGAARQLGLRCREYQLRPPANWEGISILTEK